VFCSSVLGEQFMNFEKFTIKSQEALQKSAEIAMSKQQQAIEPGHLLKAILETDENVSNYVFKKLNVGEVILTSNLRRYSILIRMYPGSNRIYQQQQTLFCKS
jgi:ATP-dependent Clp protease ATP-binding subunit ClpA